MIPAMAVTEDGVSVWFACKICTQCFQSVDNFLEHKKEVHFDEFQKFICIVFEEKTTITNNLGYDFPDASSLHTATDIKQEQLLSSDGQNLDLKPVINNEQVTEAEKDDSICQVQNETRKRPQNLFVLLKRLTPNTSAERQNCTNSLLPPAPVLNQEHLLSSDDENLDLDPVIYNDDAAEADTGGSICQVQNETRKFPKNPYVLFQRLTSKEIQQYKCQPQALEPNHLTMPSKPKALKCPFTNCQKTLKTRANLSQHIKLHTHLRPFKCTSGNCRKFFKTRNCLVQHLKVHTRGRPFKCLHTNCGKAFKTRNYWMKHCVVHTMEKRFKCQEPYCEKLFTTRNLLKSHSKTHSDEKQFKCPHPNCEKAYSFLSSFKGHLETHTKKKPFKCQEPNCGKAFKRKTHLRDHLLIHSDSRPCFHCPYPNCGKVFAKKCSLKPHWALLHAQDSGSGEKLFEYTKCDRTGCLPNSYQRLRHLGKHSGVGQHKCSVPNCGRAFKYPCFLKLHVQRHKGNGQ